MSIKRELKKLRSARNQMNAAAKQIGLPPASVRKILNDVAGEKATGTILDADLSDENIDRIAKQNLLN